MKKFIFSAMAVFSLTFAQAQETGENPGFNAGDMFISGSVGYSTTKNPDDSKTSNFNIIPRFGYFVNDFFAVGAQLGYSKNTAEDSRGRDTVDNSTFEVGVFGRYYLLPGKRFTPYGELNLGYGHTKDIFDNKVNGLNIGFMPGVSYFLSNNFAIEASVGILGYSSAKPDSDGAEATKRFDFGIDTNDINFGLIYKF